MKELIEVLTRLSEDVGQIRQLLEKENERRTTEGYIYTIPSNTSKTKTVSIPSNTSKTKNINIYNHQFLDFWSIYPRKVQKLDAAKAFDKLTETEKADALADIKSGRFNDREPQYIPHASTYLTGKRWEDETDSPGNAESKFWGEEI